MKPKTQAIIPTAGLGTRFKSEVPKPFVLLNGKPVIVLTLEVFEKSPSVDSVIVVAHHDYLKKFKSLVKRYHLSKVKEIVEGGTTRSQSVYHGLKVLDPDTEIVLIHDGARPLVSLNTVDEAVKSCYKRPAIIVAVPVKSTIKRVDHKTLCVHETLKRDELWEIQTPQVFQKDVLLRAHKAGRDQNPTDDAHLVERLGIKVKVVRGDYRNIKITTQEDLLIAKALLKINNK